MVKSDWANSFSCSISPAPSAMGLSVLQQPKHQVNLFSRNPIKSSQMSANLPLTIFLTNKSNLSQNFHNFSRVSQDFEIFDIGVNLTKCTPNIQWPRKSPSWQICVSWPAIAGAGCDNQQSISRYRSRSHLWSPETEDGNVLTGAGSPWGCIITSLDKYIYQKKPERWTYFAEDIQKNYDTDSVPTALSSG